MTGTLRSATQIRTASEAERGWLVVIGLGNEYIADDGIGIHAVRALREELESEGITVEELSVGGLQLLDYLTGFGNCIIIDAIITGKHPPGTIFRFIQSPATPAIMPTPLTIGPDQPDGPQEGKPAAGFPSSHQVNLPQVLSLGTLVGARMPHRVVVYGIEAADTSTFVSRCTDAVSGALPRLVDLIRTDLREAGEMLQLPTEPRTLYPVGNSD